MQRFLKNIRINDYTALGLVCLSLVVYQLALTKILSVVTWYHSTFLILSLVMLGLGVPGVWFSFIKNPQRLLPKMMFGSGLFMVISVVYSLYFSGFILTAKHTIIPSVSNYKLFLFSLLLVILAATLCLGATVCLFLMKAKGKQFGRMYAADLAGAFLGAVITLPLIIFFPVPYIVAGLGVMLMVTTIFNQRRFVDVSILGALVILGLMLWGTPLKVRYAKYDEAEKKTIYEKWTPTTRITVLQNIFWSPLEGSYGFAWGPGKNFPKIPRDQHWMQQDNTAGTPITRFDGKSLKGLEYLKHDVTSVAYFLRKPQSTAIIGGGGGRDILTALVAGIDDVNVIELNQGVVDTVSGPFKEFSGDIYHHPKVNTVVSEGRSYLARDKRHYDLIQISLIDSWAASIAGAFALAENNLYTKEAYQIYLKRLTPGGIITTSRWHGGWSESELNRLVVLAHEALKAEGIKYPSQHVAILKGTNIANVMVSKTPFSEIELDKLQKIALREGFEVLHPVPAAQAGILQRLLSVEMEQLVRESNKQHGVDISASTDDRPFFFNVLMPFRFYGADLSTHRASLNDLAIRTLQMTMASVSLITAILFFLPFFISKKLRKERFGTLSATLYYASIGAGFMLMEVYFIQRFILYMGHPSYAAASVIGILLLGLGLGSLASVRERAQRFRNYAMAMPLLLIFTIILIGYVFEETLGAHFFTKVVLTFLMIFPPAFLAGFFFPMGVRFFGDKSKAWFWAVNGSFGVFGSVAALPMAMTWGFTTVSKVAVLVYAAAGLILLAQRKLPKGA